MLPRAAQRAMAPRLREPYSDECGHRPTEGTLPKQQETATRTEALDPL